MSFVLIVLPQILASAGLGPLMKHLLGNSLLSTVRTRRRLQGGGRLCVSPASKHVDAASPADAA